LYLDKHQTAAAIGTTAESIRLTTIAAIDASLTITLPPLH
jgi:hypothetical protein